MPTRGRLSCWAICASSSSRIRHPSRSTTAATGDRLFRSAGAVVRLAGNVVSIDAAGDRTIDLLRAGTAAVWGAGVPIYALDVDPGYIRSP